MTPTATPQNQLNPEFQAHDRLFRVNGLASPSEMSPHLLDDDCAVVLLDVVRCTTTLTAVLAAGSSSLHVRAKSDPRSEFLLVSGLSGLLSPRAHLEAIAATGTLEGLPYLRKRHP
jgi:hypothetical protein